MVTIAVAGRADVAAAAALHLETAIKTYAPIFPSDSSPPTTAEIESQWLALIEQPDSEAFVARLDGEVVGVAAVCHDSGVPAGVRLAKLYVRSTHSRQGIGNQLHDRAIAEAQQWGRYAINLWVLEANVAARQWYERRGWSHVPGPRLQNEPPEIVDVLYERFL